MNTFKMLTYGLLIILSSGAIVHSFEYNLASPDNTYVLPKELREVSGITLVDSKTLACIEDEHGRLYFYDLEARAVTRNQKFGPNGDYEGLARVESDLFVLRSDGAVSQVIDFDSGVSFSTQWRTGITENDNEGLCYDPINNRLLIAAKDTSSKDAVADTTRRVYALNLETKSIHPEPAYSFDLNEIRMSAVKKGIPLPQKISKKGKASPKKFKMRPSAIGIHPVSGAFYLVSSTDKLLFVFNAAGEIQQIESLHDDLFKQPEGIAFAEDGGLFISNEGGEGSANILYFKPQDKNPD